MKINLCATNPIGSLNLSSMDKYPHFYDTLNVVCHTPLTTHPLFYSSPGVKHVMVQVLAAKHRRTGQLRTQHVGMDLLIQLV